MPSWAALAAKPAAPGALIAPAVADEEKAAALNGAAACASETAPALAAVEEAKPVLSAEDAALLLAKKVVLDSGAIIKGGRLEGLGQKFWTIKEVLAEVRDSKSRAVLDTLAVELEVREVDPSALAVVANFSKLTGDYQRLSAVDLKVMALTYQIEKQFHGTSHLHSRPRPATATQKTAPDRHTSAATPAETESAARDDCLDSHASALSCEGQEEEEEIDPSEFERAPLAEGEWKGGAADRDDTASVAGSEAGSKVGARTKKKSGVSSLPGWGEWEDGKDDEAGWITKDNLVASTRLDQVEERKEDDTHVACATLDGAMQNVLLQMGLKVVDTDGYVVKNVKQFVLKCHACFAICKCQKNDIMQAAFILAPLTTLCLGTSCLLICTNCANV
jgi:RNA-binding protein NOB1